MVDGRDINGRYLKGRVSPFKKTRISKKCLYCQEKFEVKPSLDRVRYCSISCAKKGKTSWNKGISPSDEAKKKMSLAKYGFRGEKHWNWRGGNREEYRARRSVDYSNWRTTVFERDNYTCQDCGFHGSKGYITAHHIKSFIKYPDLRFEISNGKTLCEECHKLTDNYKGRGKMKNLKTNLVVIGGVL